MIHRFLLILILLLTGIVTAQSYVWPTDASRYLTSAFCEFRPRHFHAAIDIKTWGQSGYKIFAIDDGYIFRMRVSSAGYGKALYLKLKDGRIALYAHLMAFTPELEQFADSLRFARRTNILDVQLSPQQFPVKKGQHIGYTGETGIGVPHLHFEMRDARNRPINPLQFFKKRVKDTVAPQATALAIIPWNAASFVNFRPEVHVLSLPRKQVIHLSTPVFVTGTVALAVKAHDRANDVGNRFGIYRAILEVNGDTVFTVQYDRFDYSRTHLVELDKNFTLWRRGQGKFQNLFRHPLNSLQIYPQTPRGSGLLASPFLRPGKNSFSIQLSDYHGNTTIIRGTLFYVIPEGIQATVVAADSNGVFLTVTASKNLHALKLTKGHLQPLTSQSPLSYELLNISQRIDQFRYDLFVPIPANPHVPDISLTPFFAPNTAGFPFRLPEVPDSIFQLYPIHGSVAYWGPADLLNSLPASIREQFIKEIPINPNTVIATINGRIFQSVNTSPLQFEHILLARLSEYHLQIPGKPGTVFAPDSMVALEFTSNSIYDSMLVTIQLQDPDELPPTIVNPRYPIKSKLYVLQPFDQPFQRGVWLKFRIPDSLQHQGIDIYYLDRRKGWQFFPAKMRNGWLSGRITSLETFALLQDTIPPVVERIPDNARGYRIPPGYLAFHIEDEMAGIFRETQISVTANGQWMLFEYDPEEKLILIPRRYLPVEGEVKITVTDNAGNQTQHKFAL